MSKLILFFLFLFLILFTIDKKPFNILLDFIGIVLTLAILIILNNKIDISIISYMLIIIYGNAIVILFGFLIMLYNFSKTFKPSSIIDLFLSIKSREIIISIFNKKIWNSSWKKTIFFLLNFILFLIFLYIFKIIILNMYVEIEQIKNLFFLHEDKIDLIKKIFEKLYNSEETWIIISLLINVLLLVMIGIIYILS